MGFFKRKNKQSLDTERQAEDRHDSDRVPSTIGATCLGEACPNFNGDDCDDSYTEWFRAKVSSNTQGTHDKPPFRDETVYVEYGQICLQGQGDNDRLVGLQYVVYDEEDTSMMELVAYSGRYGEIPVSITNLGETQARLKTIASSD